MPFGDHPGDSDLARRLKMSVVLRHALEEAGEVVANLREDRKALKSALAQALSVTSPERFPKERHAGQLLEAHRYIAELCERLDVSEDDIE
jgi:hypothetical protein